MLLVMAPVFNVISLGLKELVSIPQLVKILIMNARLPLVILETAAETMMLVVLPPMESYVLEEHVKMEAVLLEIIVREAAQRVFLSQKFKLVLMLIVLVMKVVTCPILIVWIFQPVVVSF
jgi:hypothetical protein